MVPNDNTALGRGFLFDILLFVAYLYYSILFRKYLEACRILLSTSCLSANCLGNGCHAMIFMGLNGISQTLVHGHNLAVVGSDGHSRRGAPCCT